MTLRNLLLHSQKAPIYIKCLLITRDKVPFKNTCETKKGRIIENQKRTANAQMSWTIGVLLANQPLRSYPNLLLHHCFGGGEDINCSFILSKIVAVVWKESVASTNNPTLYRNFRTAYMRTGSPKIYDWEFQRLTFLVLWDEFFDRKFKR